MLIRCPACGFSQEVSEGKIPRGSVRIVCPGCGTRSPIASGKTPLAPEKSPPVASGEPVKPEKPAFHGRGLTLLGIYMTNYLLSVITLGVYYFWGKARLRHYIYSETELMGERFVNSATGAELFLGWLKALGIFFVVFGIPLLLGSFVHEAFAFTALPAIPVLLVFAMVQSRKYRLSRSFFRAIRFSFRGTVREAIEIYFIGCALTVLTLGLWWPFFHARKERYWRGNSRYGAVSFGYNGKGKDLMRPYLVAIPLAIFTLGFYLFWFRAGVVRYDWEKTSFEGLRFRSLVTGGKLLEFALGNIALILLTLGVGYPWYVKRRLDFVFRNLEIEGAVDFEKIRQTMEKESAPGEELFGGIEPDFGLGI